MPQQQPRRFQAATLDDAYAQVRQAFGDDAVILATRRATSPGLYGRPPRSFVEVLAHVPGAPRSADTPVPVSEGRARIRTTASVGRAAPAAAPPFENPLAGSGLVDSALLERVRDEHGLRRPAPSSAHDREPADQPQRTHPAEAARAHAAEPSIAGDASDLAHDLAGELAEAASAHVRQRSEFEELLGQIGEMRGMVEQLTVERVNERIDAGPVTLKRLRTRLRDQGMTAALTADVLEDAAASRVDPSNETGLKRTVERKLAAMLPAAPHLNLARRPAVIPLVGPSGAGKTTLAMKLALEIQRAHSLRVVVAGTDVERAGAPQQFQAVGAAAGVATRLCYTPGELQALIGGRDADVVIVDTPGHDGSRRDRMSELETFVRAARQRDVLLVLPATMKAGDLESLARAYRGLDPLGVVLTRCDNTRSFGEAFSALVHAELGIAFTTHREAVSDPPRPGDNLAIARAILLDGWAAEDAAAGNRLPGTRSAAAGRAA
jgi:flagellar biosynthesis protein FlhF